MRRFEGGRGHDHISATLDEGDLVLYVDGSWEVDGVPVGEGDPVLKFAFVTLVQLVFTHNCEHGWIYGTPAEVRDGSATQDDDYDVQIGPEQLVARLDGAIGDGGTVVLDAASLGAVAAAEARFVSR